MYQVGAKEFVLNPKVTVNHPERLKKHLRESGRTTFFDRLDEKERKRRADFGRAQLAGDGKRTGGSRLKDRRKPEESAVDLQAAVREAERQVAIRRREILLARLHAKLGKSFEKIKEDQLDYLELIEKIDLCDVNSDSNASEMREEDREIEIENEILDRLNEEVHEVDGEFKAVEKFERKDNIPKLQRHKQMAHEFLKVTQGGPPGQTGRVRKIN